MPTYLLEIGTEELPASHLPEAIDRLKLLISESLKQSNLKFDKIQALGTPRRLTCIVKGLPSKQESLKKKVKGPPYKSSYDSVGNPTPAALGFAQKQGLKIADLQKEEIGGTEYLVADLTIEGKTTQEVLQDIIPRTILQLSGERLMRWGDTEIRFSRPIRWLLSLLDEKEVKIALDRLESGRHTYGNRVLAPGQINIDHPDSYLAKLKEAKVLVDPIERRNLVEKQVIETAEKLNGRAKQLNSNLLDEVTNILEWPHPIVGTFAKEYLELPDTLIETVMVHHQRYFPVEKLEKDQNNSALNNLLPYFITVANNDRKEAEAHIKQGNERVIKARLADGRFFYFDDQKVKLSQRKSALAQLTFQEGLGSYQKKSERMIAIASKLSKSLNLGAKNSICIERCLELCKLDLVTTLVRELPELQGYVGSWYAAKEGEPEEIVIAIRSHYSPRSQTDSIPQDEVGQFVAFIDKLDSLTGLFALGRRPSGSSDPYALRRQAQGLIDILIDGLKHYRINLSEIMNWYMTELIPLLENKKGFDSNKALIDLSEFLIQRVKAKLTESNISREVIDAICSNKQILTNLADVQIRATCLENLVKDPDCFNLVKAGIRISNILEKDSSKQVDTSLFNLDAENNLWHVFQTEIQKNCSRNEQIIQPKSKEEYTEFISHLKKIAAPIDNFFEKVMVNDPDTAKRNNRHAVLENIHRYFALLGDFAYLKPLIG